MLRWAGLALPAVVAVGLGWSYAGSFLHPTFLGDQGVRLDRASELVVGVGERQWLPFLQLHVHALYRLGAPVQTFLLVPYAYAVASLFLLAWLCRSVLREPREFVPATVLLLLGFAGSTFHWLGRSLYQEAIVIPLFLALVGLHRFAPRQRAAFVGVLGIGMLTREVFWIWWLSYGVLHWRGRLREPGLRRAVLALGAIPLGWLLLTGQGPLLARNAPEPLGVTPIAERAALLARGIAAEWLLPALVLSALTFAIAAAQRGWRGLAFRGFHVFSAVSLALVYGYVLLADPWHTTPGNTRALVPLFAHLLVWTLLGWHEATRLSGPARPAGRVLAALAMLSLLKVPAIAGVLGGPPPKRSVDDWDRLRLPAASRAEAGWERTLEATLEPLRARRGGPLRVALVDVSRREYLKLWVAAFLYDERRVVPAGAPLPPADVILAPEGFRAPGLVRRARLRVSSDATRDVLVPTRD